ncbi:c-type cytochrome [Devosia naphthalenivorans]|uniref:c-type cytochrome n=1 Tax=Devosia naphthalenivorans TaxID=2082392 RepID=UPI000D37D5B7|nr:cytochrome c family protein [Devosia naphthalenivorans]
MKSQIFFATAAVLALSTSSQAQDLEAGKKVFNKCMACHAVGENAKNKLGPVLNGVVDRSAGTIEGFRYSSAMQESGLAWDTETLSEFLKAPKVVVPGTKMNFPGLKSDEEVANVIAYLAQFEEDGSLAQ